MVKLKNMDFSNARLHFAFEGLIALIPYLILPFSAPVAFFTAIFLLLILSFFSPGRFARVALGICIVIGGGVCYCDCNLCHSDLQNYYNTFINLSNGNLDALFDYGKGVEFLLPLYWSIWSLLFGQISSVQFNILNAITEGTLLLIWIEKYGAQRYSRQELSVCIALLFLFYGFFELGWLMRQGYSSIFLLFALSARTRFQSFVFLALAFFCHTSAILFFPLFVLIRKFPALGIFMVIILAVMFVLGHFFPFLYSYATFLPEFFSQKLVFYEEGGGGEAGFPISIFIFNLVLLVFSILYFQKIDIEWRWIIILCGPIFFLSGIVISLHFFGRIGMLYYWVALGFFFFLVLRNSHVALYLWSFAVFVNKIRIYTLFRENGPNGTPVNVYGITGDWFYFLLQ
ncbi:EpsG family protein [Helicobacter himalayensis]|uniref:EpsG family protein n=1 Tax=Helicobacter himalayensis TaxID=1591088 RepID=UPI00082B5E47|nr:EpsG family protein [Helicobacter himalayensis]